MNKKQLEAQEAKEHLLELLKPGDTIYCTLKHVSRSGMYRAIDLHVMRDNAPVRISWYAAKLLEGYDDRHEACRASGCGMDMGFHLVNSLSYALFYEYECLGDKCPSNEHLNWRGEGPSPRGAGIQHKDGYALRSRWL